MEHLAHGSSRSQESPGRCPRPNKQMNIESLEEEYINVENVVKCYERTLTLFQNNPAIEEHNKELVLRFVRDAALGKTVLGRSKKKIGPSRLKKYINELRIFIEYIMKDIDQVNQGDMENFIE